MQKSFTLSTNHLNPVKFLRKAQIPPKQGYVWQIKSGAVRSTNWSEDGTIITLGIWGAKDIIVSPYSELQPSNHECLTMVEAILLPITDYPTVNKGLISHIQQLQEFLEILYVRPLEVSLVKFLGLLARKFGQEVEQGKLIDLRLTHQEMAEILGTTRVTVTRLLKEFQEQGIIERFPKQLILVQDSINSWYYQI